MKKVEAFTLHNNRGQSVLMCKLSQWRDALNPGNDIFGLVVRYSWEVDGVVYEKLNSLAGFSLRLISDASGFICFERSSVPDNCFLLDAYGKERMRLTVPWQLTRPKNPDSAKPPTTFVRVSAPFTNPIDGKEGHFGVEAWVEYAGQYYFELDYHKGEFLWGREIRD